MWGVCGCDVVECGCARVHACVHAYMCACVCVSVHAWVWEGWVPV